MSVAPRLELSVVCPVSACVDFKSRMCTYSIEHSKNFSGDPKVSIIG